VLRNFLKEQSLRTVLTGATSRHIIAAGLAVVAIVGAAAASFVEVMRLSHGLAMVQSVRV